MTSIRPIHRNRNCDIAEYANEACIIDAVRCSYTVVNAVHVSVCPSVCLFVMMMMMMMMMMTTTMIMS